jgi:hypothetical protein
MRHLSTHAKENSLQEQLDRNSPTNAINAIMNPPPPPVSQNKQGFMSFNNAFAAQLQGRIQKNLPEVESAKPSNPFNALKKFLIA